MKKALKVCFMGTPEFAVSSLAKINSSEHEIVGVVTAIDKQAGRGRKINQSEVKKYAIENGLPVYQPSNLKSDEFLEQIKKMNPDVIVVVAFRMLPKVIWNYPKFGTFNLHASLLPKYRGAAPIHWAIINGEKETGVTTFFIDEEIDTGKIILNKKQPISEEDKLGSLYKKLMVIGSDLVIETLNLINKHGKHLNVKSQEINEDVPSAPKLTRENTKINWNNSAKEIYNFVRGLNPFPLAWAQLSEKGEQIQIKIYGATYQIIEHNKRPGEIDLEKKRLGVYVNNGIIYIEELKAEGKRKMNIADFLNGYQLSNDAVFV